MQLFEQNILLLELNSKFLHKSKQYIYINLYYDHTYNHH